jgi:tight adherence protein B
VVESLRMAREVGGTTSAACCARSLAFLREDARTRAELETRQGWTVNAARLALCAPVVLLLLLLRPAERGRRPTTTAAGAAVLLIGGAVSIAAYRVMIRIARLPTERRVLR